VAEACASRPALSQPSCQTLFSLSRLDMAFDATTNNTAPRTPYKQVEVPTTSTSSRSGQAPGKPGVANAPTSLGPPRPLFPLYTFRELPNGTPPNVFYIRDHILADKMIPLLQSPVGFDTEWKPTYIKGAPTNKTALIQLADANTILLIQIKAMRYFPRGVQVLLQNPDIIKVGCGIRGDAIKLHSERQLDFASLLDLGTFAKEVDPVKWAQRAQHMMPGLAALCESYLERNLQKGKITRSNWEMNPMSQAMQDYAANDAHVSVMIYNRLIELHSQMESPPPLSDSLFGIDTAKAIEDAKHAEERKRVRSEKEAVRQANAKKKKLAEGVVEAQDDNVVEGLLDEEEGAAVVALTSDV